MTDIFGDIVDVDTVEHALRETLNEWLPGHLSHQERRRRPGAPVLPGPLPPGRLPFPRSWPTVSELDMEVHEQLPAVVIVSPGSVGAPERDQRGAHRKTWRFEIAVAVAGNSELEARALASMYLAAVNGALEQNRTLGGRVEKCWNVGPDDHALGTTRRGGQRALYGTAFNVLVRNTVNDRLGPPAPLPDPHDPPAPPEGPLGAPLAPNTADITVTAQP
jgi:hypothetical protein